MSNRNTTFNNSCYVRSHKTVHIRGFKIPLQIFVQEPDDGARWHKYVSCQ